MYEEICYKKPFLKEVVARIDFVAPLEALEKTLPPKLAKVLSEHFPISEPIDAIAREFELTGDGVRHRETRFKQWNFFGKEREKQLTLAAPFVFVTYGRYTTYENMKAQFAAVVEAVGNAFPDVTSTQPRVSFLLTPVSQFRPKLRRNFLLQSINSVQNLVIVLKTL